MHVCMRLVTRNKTVQVCIGVQTTHRMNERIKLEIYMK